MNRTYNIIWSVTRQAWVVASELALSAGRPPLAKKRVLSALVLLGIIAGQPAQAFTEYVSGTVYDETVSGSLGVTQHVLSGGHAFRTTLFNSGVTSESKQIVSAGGSATGTIINDRGRQTLHGGTATSSVINSGGSLYVFSGSADSTEINSWGEQYINSGGSATNTIITGNVHDNGGEQYIGAGGSAISTTINRGQQNIGAGGSAINTIITDYGGFQYISAGGSATSTTVNRGGQTISAGGSATSTTLNSEGDQFVEPGGSATSTTINDLGRQYVSGSATNTIVNYGGAQGVTAGGLATNTKVSGGEQWISDGGRAISTVVVDGGTQIVAYNGPVAIDAILNGSGSLQTVADGFAIHTIINDGGTQDVADIGIVTDTIINDGGVQNLFRQFTEDESGGKAIHTVINSGTQNILSAGSATSTIINGGLQNVNSSGNASWTEINNGGTQYVSSGGYASNTEVNSGGKQFIDTGGNIISAVINDGGFQSVLGGVVTGTEMNGGMQSVRGGEVTSTTINDGIQNVILDGSAMNAIINSDGIQNISAGGSATSTTINGGLQNIGAGGSATSTTINGGLQNINSGGSVTYTTVNNGGSLDLYSGGSLDSVTINTGGTATVYENGSLTGDVNNSGLTTLNNRAQIDGKVVNSGTLTLSDSPAATSATLSGDLTNNAVVIIGSSSAKAGRTLNINGNYVGNNAALVMNAVLGNDGSVTDKLIVGGNATGRTDVTVNNLAGKGDQTVNGIEIVHVGGTSDAGAFYNSKAIRAGLYNYTVVQKNSNFYLISDLIEPEKPQPPVTPGPEKPEPPVNPAPGKDISTAAGGYIANLAAANQVFMTRLADREGGTEYIDPVTGQRDITSLWLRQEGGHNRSRADVLRTTSNRYVAQLGGELVNGSFTDTDRWDIGLMAGYANQKGTTTSSRSRYNMNTKSQMHGYSTGLYGTWYQDAETRTGLYVDTWAQYSWFRNSVNEDGQLSDSYNSKGFSASLETGYSWKVVDGERTDFFIQPQAQLVWSGIKADDHNTRTGIRVQGEGDNNLQSRLGVKAYLKGHNKLDDNTGRSFKPFVEANWIHNTERYGVRMDGDSLNQDGAKDIAELKTGVEGQLSASTSLWGGVGVQMGDKGYSDTQGQLGLKVRF